MSEEVGEVSTVVDDLKSHLIGHLFVIPDFLDFQNSFLIVLFIVLFSFEEVYLCLP